jgi:LysR family transcriptional regulator, low CO2-responsive transcriptional regulator
MTKPGLTLHRLELFLAVLDTGGVARAAQARRLSQPAVSEHLRGLEAFFGVRLFERAGRGVRSTAAARQVEPFVRHALDLLRSAERAAVELAGLQAGAVAVGASTTPGTYLLPSALGRFHTAHPRVALTLRIGDTREVEQWVVAGSVELGMIGAAPLLPGLAGEPWLKDELVAIVTRRHHLARRRAVPAGALAGEPYITREEGSSTRASAERFFAESGVTPHIVMQLGSTEAIREAVAAGLGVSVVSRHAVQPRDPRVVPLRLHGARSVRDLLVIYREGAELSPAAARLREMLLPNR